MIRSTGGLENVNSINFGSEVAGCGFFNITIFGTRDDLIQKRACCLYAIKYYHNRMEFAVKFKGILVINMPEFRALMIPHILLANSLNRQQMRHDLIHLYKYQAFYHWC